MAYRIKLIKDSVAQYYFFARIERELTIELIRELLPTLEQLRDRGLADATLAKELTALLESMQLLRPGAETDHFLVHWFSEWFPGQPVATIVLEGAISACLRATEGPKLLPITGYWVASSDEAVKVAVCKSVQQVTVLLITPPPDTRVPLRSEDAKPAPVWITRAKNRRQVGTEQVMIAPLKESESRRKSAKKAGVKATGAKATKRKTTGKSKGRKR